MVACCPRLAISRSRPALTPLPARTTTFTFTFICHLGPRRHVMSTDLSNLYRPQVHHKHTGARLPLLLHVLTRYSKGLRAQPAGTGDGGPNGFADDSDGGAAPKSAAAAEREASETRVVAASPKGFEEPPGGSSNGDEAVTGGDGFGLTSNAPAKMESRRSVPPEDGVEFVRVGGGGGIQLPPGDVGVAGFAALPKMLSRMSLALLLLAAVGSTFDGISCIVGSASLSQSILVEKAVVSTLRTSSASMRTERSRLVVCEFHLTFLCAFGRHPWPRCLIAQLSCSESERVRAQGFER